MRKSLIAAAVGALVTGGPAHLPARTTDALAFRAIDTPAGPGSALPQLVTTARGTILSWLESAQPKHHRFRFAERQQGRWTDSRTIVEGDRFFANWADVPAIWPQADGRLVAHWLERNGSGTYAYGVRVKRSDRSRRTWSPTLVPHRDESETEHGFVSAFAAGDGLGLIWLDGRDAAKYAGAGEHDMRAQMSLRYTRLDAQGAFSAETIVDPRVCDCCPTAAARTRRGAVVAYRDRSATEIRDIAVVRLQDGRWTAPAIVHRDGWNIPGCPVNGPALASNGDDVALAWFTAANNDARVFVSFSRDGGATWTAAARVDDGVPLGRVDVVWLSDRRVAVSWIAHNDGRPELRVRTMPAQVRVKPDAPSHAPDAATTKVTLISGERSSGYPRLAVDGGALLVAWTEAGPPLKVRMAAAPLGLR